MNNITNIKEEVEKLRAELRELEQQYYAGKGNTKDSYYDFKIQKLIAYETQYPNLKTPDSPSQGVGHTDFVFEKKTHEYPMLSLKNVFNHNDLQKYIESISGSDFFIEPKVDGTSVSLIYKDGQLSDMITRGDGEVGESIISKSIFINGIPQSIPYTKDVVVRGEIFMNKSDFQELSANMKASTPRNTVAGSLRLKKLDKFITFKLRFVAFQVLGNTFLSTQADAMNFLNSMSFATQPIFFISDNYSKIIDFLNGFKSLQKEQDIPMDGAVIKVNDLNTQTTLGNTSKFPRWAVAYKYESEAQETELLNIIQTTGRTGKITFIGILKPVVIGGSVIKNVILHNSNYILSNKIQIGSYLTVFKSGEIIPKVLGVVLKDGQKTIPWTPPTHCACGGELICKRDIQFCDNTSCKFQAVARIQHFVMRGAMNIDGLSDFIIQKMYNHKLITDIFSIFELKDKRDEILGCQLKIQTKLLNKLLESIERSKTTYLHNFVFSLGINHVGKEISKIICSKLNTLDDVLNLRREDIINMDGCGKIVADSLHSWLNDPNNILLVNKFRNTLLFKKNKFIGKLAITGKFPKTRRELIEEIKTKNYEYTESLNADFLLVGESPGAKLIEAKKKGVKIIFDLNEIP